MEEPCKVHTHSLYSTTAWKSTEHGLSLSFQTKPTKPAIAVLPDDVLSDIFQTLSDSDYHNINTPLFLSHCCVRWRRVALRLSLLWTSIKIDSLEPEIVDRAEAWVARSNARGLHISITQHIDWRSDQLLKQLSSCLEFLKPHARRWKSLYIRTTSDYDLFELSQLVSDLDLPGLISLHLIPTLRDQVGIPEITEDLPLGINQSFQALQSLTVPDILFSRHYGPWAQITSLFSSKLRRLYIITRTGPKETFFSIDHCLRILQVCFELDELHILTNLGGLQDHEHHFGNLQLDNGDQIIVAPNLITLNIHPMALIGNYPRVTNENIVQLLLRIRAPALTGFGSFHLPLSLVAPLVKKPIFAYPALESITIRGYTEFNKVTLDHLSYVVRLLRQLPYLRSLTFVGIRFILPNEFHRASDPQKRVTYALSGHGLDVSSLVLLDCFFLAG